VISIYAQGNYKLFPLPSLEEVLICDHNTTVEEVNLCNFYLCSTTYNYAVYVCTCSFIVYHYIIFIVYLQISLLWYRAIRDPDHKQIFCLVNGEKLPYQVCIEAFEEMDKILKGETGKLFNQHYIFVTLLCTDYQLVVVCSNEDKEERTYIMEHLQLSHRDASAVIANNNTICEFLEYHMSHNAQYGQQIFASEVDIDK